jgi:glucose-6-phosphate isomerase
VIKYAIEKFLSENNAPSAEDLRRARGHVDALLSREELGFLRLPSRGELWEKSEARALEVKKNFKRLAVLGIGGSSLGGLTLREALDLEGLEFFENVDARDFWDRLRALPLEDVHWAVISKSGRTVETLTQANFVHAFLKDHNLDFARRATVISETKSNPLSDWARKNAVPLLEIPEDVGGRFSVLSPVGMFPAAFGGAPLAQLREGAARALENKDLVARLTAAYLKSFEREKWITVFWAYCNRLRSFGLWLEQLWAESLGKKQGLAGQPAPRAGTPISLVGANDQHSVLQQVMEGAKDKFVTFFRVGESETYGDVLKENLFKGEDLVVGKSMGQLLAAEATATQRALAEAGVPSLSLEMERIDARALGELFMLFEIVVGALGEAHGINAFDQPGVELGKRLAKEILLK